LVKERHELANAERHPTLPDSPISVPVIHSIESPHILGELRGAPHGEILDRLGDF
jgi:hypothetical protein